MAKEEQTSKTPVELTDRAWELAASIRVALFCSLDKQHRQHVTPMSAHVIRDEHAVYFLVDRSAEKVNHLASNSNAVVAFSDEGSNKYVTLSGTASVSADRVKIRELFSPFAKAWWDSADDPSIRLITFRPNEGELWDGPNKLVATAIMLSAAITGAKLPLGDHAKVDV